jgi:hypothetical protein
MTITNTDYKSITDWRRVLYDRQIHHLKKIKAQRMYLNTASLNYILLIQPKSKFTQLKRDVGVSEISQNQWTGKIDHL